MKITPDTAYRPVKRFYPVWPKISSHAFILTQKEVDAELENQKTGRNGWARQKAKRYATPLLLCVAVVELSDVMFAFDSVPAIIAVSREPLIIYSAMMFAILGLRTLYFVLEALKQYLVHGEGGGPAAVLRGVQARVECNRSLLASRLQHWRDDQSVRGIRRAGAGDYCERDVPGET